MSLCAGMLCGCAYVQDRARDATDMVTIAGEVPIWGAGAWAGRVGVGWIFTRGYGFGLRSGALGTYEFEEIDWLFFNGWKKLSPSQADCERGKGYAAFFGSSGEWDDNIRERLKGGWFNHGQIEAWVGFIAGVRVGVNVFEIADFILGWTTIDICNDDVASRRKSVPPK